MFIADKMGQKEGQLSMICLCTLALPQSISGLDPLGTCYHILFSRDTLFDIKVNDISEFLLTVE